MASSDDFPARLDEALSIAKQNRQPSHPPLRSGLPLRSRCRSTPADAFVAKKAALGVATSEGRPP